MSFMNETNEKQIINNLNEIWNTIIMISNVTFFINFIIIITI